MVEWRTIPSYPDFEASSFGQIRRRWKRGRAGKPGKIRALQPLKNVYLVVSVGYPSETRLVNRLVCEAFHGPPPTPEHQAAHLDGARTNNVPSNLKWKTRPENYEDQILHGTSKKGEGHHIAKLTDQAVREIRALAGTMLQREIGDLYGIGDSHVCQILSRKLWSHVT